MNLFYLAFDMLRHVCLCVFLFMCLDLEHDLVELWCDSACVAQCVFWCCVASFLFGFEHVSVDDVRYVSMLLH